MKQPLVSVLMPVYNADRYVAKAVESILNQTFRDFEFIIIDDGSTDRSLEILRRYEKQDPRIRLISRPNTGYVVALNEMLDMARGNLVARMDADDVAMVARFKLQIDYLRRHQEVVVLGTRVLLVDPEGLPIREICVSTSHDSIDSSHLNGHGTVMCHPSVMMRVAAVRMVGEYRTEFYAAEDLELFLRLAEVGRLANLAEVLLHYRMHGQSIGHARMSEQQRKAALAVTAARVRRGLSPMQPGPVAAEPALMTEHSTRWAWWALGAGHVRTARKHAIRALFRRPLSLASWRLAGCAARGR